MANKDLIDQIKAGPINFAQEKILYADESPEVVTDGLQTAKSQESQLDPQFVSQAKAIFNQAYNQAMNELAFEDEYYSTLEKLPVGSCFNSSKGWIVRTPNGDGKAIEPYIAQYINRLEKTLIALPRKIQEAELKFQNITTEQFLKIKLKRLKATFNWKMHLVKYRIKSTFRRVFK